MPSFDIVCEVDLQEVDNAVNQVAKEMATRFDFRGGKSSIDFDRNGKVIKINADDEMKLRSIHQMLETRLAKREIDLRVLQYQDAQEASGKLLKQNVTLRSGLNKEEAKKITKYIKDSGMKIQSQIQDNQVRVTGKQIDDLQEIIASLKAGDLGLPLQYVNMRR